VAGPLGPFNVTVAPEIDATNPNALSLPPRPAALGVGLAEGVVEDEVLVVGFPVVVDGAGGFDDPQAASDSAVNPASAAAAHRDT
jgi:hypothetical protein